MADSDSQIPIFLERIQGLFQSSDEPERDERPRQGVAITVCVLLSFVLWLSLTLQEQRTVTLDLPIDVPAPPEGQAFVEVPPSMVRAQVQGSGLELLQLLFSPPPVPIRLEQSEVDVREALELPRGTDLRVETVSPRTFRVETEPRVERRVPVRSRVEVTPAAPYELIEAPTLRPDSVTVTGAESVVAQLQAWPTEARQVTNLKDTVETAVPLADTLRRLVDRSVDQVTVVARAGRFAEGSQRVTVEVTGIPSSQDVVDLQPSTIRIQYRVLFEQLFRAQRSSEFFATVSYGQIRSDTTGYVTPNITVPSDLLIRNPEPVPSRLRYYTTLSDE